MWQINLLCRGPFWRGWWPNGAPLCQLGRLGQRGSQVHGLGGRLLGGSAIRCGCELTIAVGGQFC
jgi:hypothetical protein